ncbi:MAG: di-heme oxidoredictase family protein [Gammaproteobacteria bacterium]
MRQPLLPAIACFAAAGLVAACGGGNGDAGGASQQELSVPAYADTIELGGDTTDVNASRSSFGFSTPAANLDPAGLTRHIEGDAAFEQAFVPFGEPGQERVDGLGRVFNNSSCNACHQRDGRGTPPAPGETFTKLGQNESLLLAISVDDGRSAPCDPAFNNDYCAPQPVPGFGRQVFSARRVRRASRLAVQRRRGRFHAIRIQHHNVR